MLIRKKVIIYSMYILRLMRIGRELFVTSFYQIINCWSSKMDGIIKWIRIIIIYNFNDLFVAER